MIDPVSANNVRPPQELYNDMSFVETGPGSVSSADQQRFEALIAPEQVGEIDTSQTRISQAEPEDPWVQVPDASAPPPPPTLGESILNGVESMRGNWRETVGDIEAALAKTSFDPAELMQLQFQVQHTSLVTSLVLNEVTAINQEVSQLMKAG